MIELLVGMAITSILMVALFALVGQSTDSYTRTQRAVNTISQARAFIQFFGRELSTRLPRTPLIHEAGSGEGVEASDKIAFIRAISPDEQQAAGDLNLVSYRVAFTQDAPNLESPKLFRAARNPKLTQTFLETPGTPAFPADDPALDEPIVANVIGFTAQPRFYSGTPPVLEDWTETSPDPPSVIELTVRFIDDSSAQRFRTRADWDRLADSPRDSEIQLIRTFTRSIAIAK
jgi:type II secretory pathway pseudopilin PulG